jgi:hypothetical protein
LERGILLVFRPIEAPKKAGSRCTRLKFHALFDGADLQPFVIEQNQATTPPISRPVQECGMGVFQVLEIIGRKNLVVKN